MRQKEETNLVVIVKVEVGTRELALDDLPEPVHWQTKRDVRGKGWTLAPGEEAMNLPRASPMMDLESQALANGPESLS
jgi:hypothetical protein